MKENPSVNVKKTPRFFLLNIVTKKFERNKNCLRQIFYLKSVEYFDQQTQAWAESVYFEVLKSSQRCQVAARPQINFMSTYPRGRVAAWQQMIYEVLEKLVTYIGNPD